MKINHCSTEIISQEEKFQMAVEQWFDLMIATLEYKKNKSLAINKVKRYGK